MEHYPQELEEQMRKLYQSLSEKDRRRYAAIEALKLDHGGIAYISTLFDVHPNTLSRGIAELKGEATLALEPHGIRKKGVVESLQRILTP